MRNDDTFGVLAFALWTDRYDFRFVPEWGHSFTDAGSARATSFVAGGSNQRSATHGCMSASPAAPKKPDSART